MVFVRYIHDGKILDDFFCSVVGLQAEQLRTMFWR